MADSDPQSAAALQAVLQALESLYRDPDKAAKEQANAWLQDFQKTVCMKNALRLGEKPLLIWSYRLVCVQQPEAWQTANSLLLAQDLPIEPRLFAAQTFRTKVSVIEVLISTPATDRRTIHPGCLIHNYARRLLI